MLFLSYLLLVALMGPQTNYKKFGVNFFEEGLSHGDMQQNQKQEKAKCNQPSLMFVPENEL